ncbi:MAG: hypothetical protein GY857_06770, partial [Desulfobacula sp.]|nr:hypothetical protein [Desulfobacula sp.]
KVLLLKPGLYDKITKSVIQITTELRSIKLQIDDKKDSLQTAITIFDLLHILSIAFFDLYFATLSNGRRKA